MAAVLLQQLRDFESRLPAVVFNSSELPNYAETAIAALGGQLISLEPIMPVPESFIVPLSRSHGRVPAWRKLALWAQHRYSKIIYLDVDVILMKNIDHMAAFPADSFTPEVCSFPKCEPSKIPAGINVGVMVIAPSLHKFHALKQYARKRAADLEANAHNETVAAFLGRLWLGSAEQSFLREFHEDVWNISLIEPVIERRGWDWGARSYNDTGNSCKKIRKRDKVECTPGIVNVLSRRYNARPLDCARCPWDIDNVIVHYACFIKPWDKPRHDWRTLAWCRDRHGVVPLGGHMLRNTTLCAPCLANMTERWFEAEDRMCVTLEAERQRQQQQQQGQQQTLFANAMKHLRCGAGDDVARLAG